MSLLGCGVGGSRGAGLAGWGQTAGKTCARVWVGLGLAGGRATHTSPVPAFCCWPGSATHTATSFLTSTPPTPAANPATHLSAPLLPRRELRTLQQELQIAREANDALKRAMSEQVRGRVGALGAEREGLRGARHRPGWSLPLPTPGLLAARRAPSAALRQVLPQRLHAVTLGNLRSGTHHHTLEHHPHRPHPCDPEASS